MKWRIKLGRWLGIDVFVHATFLILLGIIAVAYYATTGDVGQVYQGLLFFLALFTCVLLHEFGHALMARRYGIKTHDITLLPIGGLARLEKLPEKPIQELWVAVAGPMVNVVIAGILYLVLRWQGQNLIFSESALVRGDFLYRLMMVNIGLVVFNMIPAFPMDGGRVLRAILAMFMPYAKATRIAAVIGQGFAVVFAVAAFFGNIMLLLIAFFVWSAASSESSAVQFKAVLNGARVRDAMQTHFLTLAPEDTLSRAAELVMAGFQHDFPVMNDDDVCVGVLTRSALLDALPKVGLLGTVEEAMQPLAQTLDADESLDDAMAHIHTSETPLLPVVSRGKVIGILETENVSELYLIRSALEAYHNTPRTVPV